MHFYNLAIISIALGLDAFSIAFSVGLNKKTTKKKALMAIMIFGFFQFLFVTAGGCFGGLFNMYIFHLSSKLGGIIVLLVGMLMLREGLSEEEKLNNLNFAIIVLLGICVSIDALVIGFTLFSNINMKTLMLKNSIVVGLTASLLTAGGLIFSKKMRKNNFLKNYATLIGGVILILFGLKMIIY
ncbi:MAG: manganese efflux pump [Tissierellales bacterium]